MKPLLKLSVLFLLILSSAIVVAQNRQEAVTHFHKAYYFPGETIFFKSYVFDGLKLATKQRGFSVGIYDAEGKLIQNKLYPLVSGTGTGDFQLPDTMKAGNLSFCVFDGSERTIDRRKIHILNRNGVSLVNCATQVTPVFYAEGGNMIAGLSNMVIVKTFDKNGLPIPLLGAIKETGSMALIDSFYTDNSGIGRLNFFPVKGKSYVVEWKDVDGKKYSKDFLPYLDNGILMHVEAGAKELFLNIMNNTGNKEKLTIQIIQLTDSAETMEMVAEVDKQVIIKTELNKIPKGLCKILLIGENNKTLQQRIVNNPVEDEIELTVIKKDFSPKGLNYYRIKNIHKPFIWGSLSVTDYQMSGCDITGMRVSGSGSMEMLQNLMSEGKRKHADWLLASLKPTDSGDFKDETGLKILAMHSDKTIEGIRDSIMVLLDDSLKRRQIFYMDMMPNGTYSKNDVMIFGTASAHYQYKVNKDFSDKIVLKSFTPPVPITIPPFLECIEKDSTQLLTELAAIFQQPVKQKFGEMQTLKEVTVNRRKVNPVVKRLEELDDEYATGAFRGGINWTQFNVIDDPNKYIFRNIQSYIVGKIPSIQIVNDRIFYVRGFDKVLVPVFVDDNELIDQQGLSTIPLEQIAYFKFKPGIVIGSFGVSNVGVLAIYLKKGNEKYINREPPTMRKATLRGYDIASQYYFPDYSNPAQVKSEDRRGSLYWNPDVMLDEEGKFDFEFYNNDISKKFVVTFWGLTENGELLYYRKLID